MRAGRSSIGPRPVDVSGSIDAEEAKLQRQGYVAAFLNPEVLSAMQSGYDGVIAVSYFEWASVRRLATACRQLDDYPHRRRRTLFRRYARVRSDRHRPLYFDQQRDPVCRAAL